MSTISSLDTGRGDRKYRDIRRSHLMMALTAAKKMMADGGLG